MASSPNVVVTSDFGPIIINIFDQYIGPSIVRTGYWGSADINIIKQLMEVRLKTRASVLFYDVGANVGTHSLALSKLFGERIRIRAFEAQAMIFQMLCGTLALNSVSNVRSHLNAVSDRDGDVLELDLPDYRAPNNFGGFELVDIDKTENQTLIRGGNKQKVQTISLDSFDEEVDFIKMDIEGMEHLALRGASKTIERARPYCFIETKKSDQSLVLKFFADRNYEAYDNGDDVIFLPIEHGLNVSGRSKIDMASL